MKKFKKMCENILESSDDIIGTIEVKDLPHKAKTLVELEQMVKQELKAEMMADYGADAEDNVDVVALAYLDEKGEKVKDVNAVKKVRYKMQVM